MYERSWAGGGATSSDATTACWNSGFWLKSGIPLLCWSSWATVTSAHAAGWSGSLAPTVSSSERLPSPTSDSAAAPLYALATLGEAHRVAGGDFSHRC